MGSKQLTVFARVYEEKNLSRAAWQSNLSQSAVSFHLKQLEEEYGTQLFIREARGMRPTAAAERLYSHVAPILRAMRALQEDMKKAPDRLTGEIAIGMASSVMKAIGRSLISNVLREYPDVRLSIMEAIPGSTLLEVLKTNTDLAMVFNPFDYPELKKKPILKEQMVCVGRPDIIGATDEPIEIEEFLSLPLIMFRRLGKLIDDTLMLKQIDARARIRINSMQAIGDAILDGHGCMLGSRMYFREQIEAGTLHFRTIAGPPIERTLYICELADRPSTLMAETMSALLIEMICAKIHEGEWRATPLISC
ncbi:LysR family transcriptional regulator [Candidimonas nitroreducens]|uniref:Transcriptional regulator n=1 Tax=Candidimonas nitroreducens TaxID=683354 RepID=A0A225M4R2_9BURK|nr:LysR family transcriptional regulator [Candidimonas nitroreducens]OWT53939.1 transcriptional regulator [Candidimonas nitroreducens]